MAAGLSATLDRLTAIIENADPSSAWFRLRQRVGDITDVRGIQSGFDYAYFIGSDSRDDRPVVNGSVVTTVNSITIELARFYGGGELVGDDYFSLMKELEAKADIVEQCLLYKNNWATNDPTSPTGLWLLSLKDSSAIENSDKRFMYRKLEFEAIIRQPKTFIQI